MQNFPSNHGQVLLALQSVVKDLQPEDLGNEEVEIRPSWLINGNPMRGVSIFDMGEQYSEGTVSTQDIGYACGVVFARLRDGDATLVSDQLLRWRELVRRRLTDQRLPVTITNATAPREHVCIVEKSGEELTNLRKYPNYLIRKLTVVVWLRELPTS